MRTIDHNTRRLRRLRRWLVAPLLMLALVGGAAAGAAAAPAGSDSSRAGGIWPIVKRLVQQSHTHEQTTLEVEVAGNATTLSFDEAPVFDTPDGPMPDYGNAFMVQGYVYPKGAIEEGHDGINADGSSEYPDDVIGTWYCYGYFLGNGVATESGPWVLSQQVFDFGDVPGRDTITTSGLERPEPIAIQRAVTGGTGKYEGVSGIQTQTTVQFNETQAVNVDVIFELKAL